MDSVLASDNTPPSMLSVLCSNALQGHREVVKVLLNHGADANIRASNNSTPLINASRLNQPDIMKLLLAKGALLITGTGVYTAVN